MMRKYILAIIALLMVSVSYAQSDVQEVFKIRAAEKVALLCDYIEFIANPKNKYDAREIYITKALNLFINKGNEYALS